MVAHAEFVSRTQIDIRQACYADHTALRDFLRGLSPRARYLRFFTGAVSTSSATLRMLAGGGDHIDAVVAVKDGVIIGHAMASDTTSPGGSRMTEIGVVVTDACQGRGVGSALIRTLAARAQARGITTVTMDVLAENRQVLGMIAHYWPAARHNQSGPYVTIEARLPQPAAQRRVHHPEQRRLPQPSRNRPPRPREERPSERLAIPH
jgi:ribosomal protein S18 acetylase RimI-like enzyme